MDQGEVVNKLRRYKKLLEDNLEMEDVILYGSYAKGSERPDSDIDVAVVIKNLGEDYFSDVPLLWKLRRQVDYRIEPLVFESGKDPTGFLQEIKNSGIPIN